MSRSVPGSHNPRIVHPVDSFPPRGTLIAFDYGTRRVGVAVGDLETRSAHPLTVIRSEGAARFVDIERLVDEWRPSALVVGVPQNASGPHPLAARAERFARQLAGRFGLPVARVDEAYSSVEAEARLRAAAGARRAAQAARAKALDAQAAQLLLEQFFAENAT